MNRFLLTLVATLALARGVSAAEQPNVLIILTDDQGWGDLSVHGNTNLSTPNIDTLARDGALFDRFYVCAVCSPTRAEFLTGRYHPRGGVRSTSSGGERLDLDESTIAQAFQAGGYSTGAFGKWHNGTQFPYHPRARGFDEYYGFTSGHWGSYWDPLLDHNGELTTGKGFIIDDLADHAMQFMADNTSKKKPFFCYVPFNTPHSPMQSPDEYWNRFKDKELKLRATDPKLEEIDHTRAALAMCENIDWNVGRMLKKLDELKVAENTIVIYFCDNGPNGWRWTGGMKGRKGSVDEGGIRSPFLIRWPAKISGGKKVMQIAGAIDLLPTLTDLCGVKRVGDKPLDGVSLKPILLGDGKDWPERTYFSYWSRKVSARTQQYRLDDSGALFDMVADPGQTKDVAKEHQDIAKKLGDSLAAFRQEMMTELGGTAGAPAPKKAKAAEKAKAAGKKAEGGGKKGGGGEDGGMKDDRPFLVGSPEYPLTQLPARDGVEHGKVKRSGGAPNCSYFTNWTTKDDSITWDVEVKSAGTYDVQIMYTCPKDDVGSTVEMSCNGATVQAKVAEAWDPPAYGMEKDHVHRGSESYVKDFKPMSFGTIDLKPGRSQLTLKALEVPGKSVMEVRMILLRKK